MHKQMTVTHVAIIAISVEHMSAGVLLGAMFNMCV